jgi:hypothetical protein
MMHGQTQIKFTDCSLWDVNVRPPAHIMQTKVKANLVYQVFWISETLRGKLHKTRTRAARYCKCLLSGWWSSGTFRCGDFQFRSCYFSNIKRLDDSGESVCIFGQWRVILLYTLCFSLHSTCLNILIVQLTFLNFYDKKKFPKFLRQPSRDRPHTTLWKALH